METIKSVPVICRGCIEKLNNCPICRNDSSLRRSLKLEKIVQRLEGFQPENGLVWFLVFVFFWLFSSIVAYSYMGYFFHYLTTDFKFDVNIQLFKD